MDSDTFKQTLQLLQKERSELTKEELLQCLTFYEDMVDQLPFPVYINDFVGNTVFINKCDELAPRDLGMTTEDILAGKNKHQELLHPEDYEIIAQAAGTVAQGKSVSHVLRYKDPQENWNWFYGVANGGFAKNAQSQKAEYMLCATFNMSQQFGSIPHLLTALKESAQKRYEEQVARLSEREKEVLQQIASGETMKEIAAHLGLSAHTIEQHSRNMRNKLNLRNNAELSAFAKDAGLA